ncbi:DNA repair protein RadA [Fodinicola acaciae]|uniref:DNA repair protein RadA n=1 Tax=Fodinicola acaciae TaxID=2681555 RepID=UPI0013D78174|nr:DNA repair protein RadA [Fodinicola acaciae]
MVKERPAFHCEQCGFSVPKWVGRCPDCGAWGSVTESVPTRTPNAGPVSAPARPIAEIAVEEAKARPTGVGELDRVLGSGLVPGAVILLAGEPGVGKSTLLLEVAQAYAAAGSGRSLVVTGEESAAQVRLRAERTGALSPDLYLAAETDLSAVLTHLDEVQPGLLILDSVQTVAAPGVDAAAGGVTQVRAVASALTTVAKTRGIAVVLVGHVTKDGNIAGPRVLEHIVDVVLQFTGEQHSPLRLVRAVKNRFGPADEVGCFEMHDAGIRGLPDPSGLFLNRHNEPVIGTCVTVTMEGRRPLLAEVQALAAESAMPNPRRAVSGLDHARTAMTLAVVERHANCKLGSKDVFTATVGGHRITEPAADLAVAMAVMSSVFESLLPADLVAVGEVGLSGELRRVSGTGRRLAEAHRLGFRHALVPADCDDLPPKMNVYPVADLRAAMAAVKSMKLEARRPLAPVRAG